MGDGRTYLCIDLKSFYASVECADRGLDPFTTNLVVADPDRTEKTICLAVSPALKALGLPGRCRVFEIPEGVDYVMARPRMRRYMDVSADIYSVYLRYVSPRTSTRTPSTSASSTRRRTSRFTRWTPGGSRSCS